MRKLVLGKLVTGEVSVGEISGWGNCVGEMTIKTTNPGLEGQD